MQKTSLRAKLGLIFAGILLGLILLEFLLRAGGWLFLNLQERKNQLSLQHENQTRILCLGESTTAEGGENAYPRQLERVLNSSTNQIKFTVINKGIPGITTTDILRCLPEYLDVYRPHIVVTMMGINDALPETAAPGESTSKNPIRSFLKNIRIVKLYKWLLANMNARLGAWSATRVFFKNSPQAKTINDAAFSSFSENLPSLSAKKLRLAILGISWQSEGKLAEAEQMFRHLIANDNNFNASGWWLYRQLGKILKQEGQYRNYIDTIRILLKHNSSDAWSIQEVQQVCRERKNDSSPEDMILSLIDQNPRDAALYELLGSCYAEQGNSLKADQVFAKGREAILATVNPVTRENYHRLAEILEARKVIPVFVQYPLRPIQGLYQLLDGVVAAKSGIFIDNEKIFRDALAHGRYEDYFTDRFAGDFGHCTPLGNRLLAGNIAKGIMTRLHIQ